jgi:hypothetical protein
MNKKMYIIGGVVLTLFVVYWIFSDNISSWFTSSIKEEDGEKVGDPVIESPVKLDENKVLMLGSKGEEVKELQRILNSMGASLDVDGSFGLKTQTSLFKYSKLYKITLKYARIGAKSNSIDTSIVEYGSATGIGGNLSLVSKDVVIESPSPSIDKRNDALAVVESPVLNNEPYQLQVVQENYYGGGYVGGMTTDPTMESAYFL